MNGRCLVLSPNVLNQHSPVILLAAITSRKTEKVYPHEALIEPPDGGLTQRSKVLLMQMRAVDKRRLVGHYGSISDETMVRVERALRIATGLDYS